MIDWYFEAFWRLEASAAIALSLPALTALAPLALRSRGAPCRGYSSRSSAVFPLPPHKGVVT
jgi:hypothetical protein